jgi:hypothetical protein
MKSRPCANQNKLVCVGQNHTQLIIISFDFGFEVKSPLCFPLIASYSGAYELQQLTLDVLKEQSIMSVHKLRSRKSGAQSRLVLLEVLVSDSLDVPAPPAAPSAYGR